MTRLSGTGFMLEGMRTSEVAVRAGVNPQTLRYYEQRGLLPEPPRTAGGFRIYPNEVVRMIRFVKRAQELGFALDEVEQLLHLARGGPASCDAARALAEARITDLEARIAELSVMRDSLARLIETCTRPSTQRECPLLEALQPGDEPG